MYNANKFQPVCFFIIGLAMFFMSFFSLPVFADLPFDPNDYTFLVYDSEAQWERSIRAAMLKILGRDLTQSEIRGPSNPVTPNDLATHDILIVGWNNQGDATGLDPNILLAGITGRVILTGHDLDFHTANPSKYREAAEKMLIQSIDYVLQGGGTGLITLGCTDGFPYLPAEWGVSAQVGGSETVTEFTSEGLTSGVYDGLTPQLMSNWGYSFHNTFTIGSGSDFVSFELGGNGDANVTIARISAQLPPGCENITLSKTKTEEIEDCIIPSIEGIWESEITYDVNYSIPCEINDIKIVDTLPEYCDFNSCTGDGVWSEPNHTVTWNLNDIDPCQNGGFTLTVKVANDAPQGESIENTVRMYSGSRLIRTATEDTNICCVDKVVYVDKDAPADGNGGTWETAYNNLQTALAAVRNNEHICAEQIWVADGNYSPTNSPSENTATFQMIPGIDMYGHFQGGESNIDQRNLADSNNTSTLSGDVNNDGTSDIDIIITAANNARLDGFTVKKGRQYNNPSAIYCNNVSTTIANCIIKNNNYYGLKCYASDVNCFVSIINCIIEDNQKPGLYCSTYSIFYPSVMSVSIDRCTINSNKLQGIRSLYKVELKITNSIIANNSGTAILAEGRKVTVQNCNIIDNSGHGINASASSVQAIVKNCIINSNNDTGIIIGGSPQANIANNIISDNNSYGIEIDGGNAVIRNNLIYNNCLKNHNSGIYLSQSSEVSNNTIVENKGYGITNYADPNINSNIIWDNTSGGINGSSNKVNYNCLQSGYAGGGIGNIIGQNPQLNDYHLTTASIYCIDKGNPNYITEPNEIDIDGEDRVMDGDRNNAARVDIGADEFNPYDLSQDGFVDFLDFAVFAQPWKTSQGQTGYNDYCDFYNDNVINFKDLEIFCRYWLTPDDWEGIGGDGAYFADTPFEGDGQMQMMMLMPSQSPSVSAGDFFETQPEQMITESLSTESATESVEYVEEVPVVSEVEPFDVNEALNWLDDLWQTDEDIGNSIDANDWQKFIESIKNSE